MILNLLGMGFLWLIVMLMGCFSRLGMMFIRLPGRLLMRMRWIMRLHLILLILG